MRSHMHLHMRYTTELIIKILPKPFQWPRFSVLLNNRGFASMYESEYDKPAKFQRADGGSESFRARKGSHVADVQSPWTRVLISATGSKLFCFVSNIFNQGFPVGHSGR